MTKIVFNPDAKVDHFVVNGFSVEVQKCGKFALTQTEGHLKQASILRWETKEAAMAHFNKAVREGFAINLETI